MADQSQYAAVSAQPDAKRRKLDPEAIDMLQSKGDKAKGNGVDKAKANYLSGQLRLRLQYAKLKVEHGWQRQSLNEVENLYFRHTHLTRPYPVISPGGRRSGRTTSSNGTASSISQYSSNAALARQHTEIISHGSSSLAGSVGSSTLDGTSSTSSVDTTLNPSIPSTPNIDAGRMVSPHAPHVGFNGVTRYPVSRSDSTATIIVDSVPALGRATRAHNVKPDSAPANPPPVPPSPSSQPASGPQLNGSSSTSTPSREPFDPMQPTEHIDSQLAALRSMVAATSSTPIPLPPPQSTPNAPPSFPGAPPSTSTGAGNGLTYDAFWSSHSATSSYRSLLGGQNGSGAAGFRRSSGPLQAHASAPAALTPAPATSAAGAPSTIAHGSHP
ncbi:hypothetical protein FKP32DRAFT_1592032 [Trametes sanguinea]|nr:hypothetical protein FKP32DRAFT_1592032 [Trametes sanguinea]